MQYRGWQSISPRSNHSCYWRDHDDPVAGGWINRACVSRLPGRWDMLVLHLGGILPNTDTELTTTAAPYSKCQIVRFAGDSGDGISVAGAAIHPGPGPQRSQCITLPDCPTEIRALPGSRFGVSAFQIQFGTEQILTPGASPDARSCSIQPPSWSSCQHYGPAP